MEIRDNTERSRLHKLSWPKTMRRKYSKHSLTFYKWARRAKQRSYAR